MVADMQLGICFFDDFVLGQPRGVGEGVEWGMGAAREDGRYCVLLSVMRLSAWLLPFL